MIKVRRARPVIKVRPARPDLMSTPARRRLVHAWFGTLLFVAVASLSFDGTLVLVSHHRQELVAEQSAQQASRQQYRNPVMLATPTRPRGGLLE
jgi:hypothetical protein